MLDGLRRSDFRAWDENSAVAEEYFALVAALSTLSSRLQPALSVSQLSPLREDNDMRLFPELGRFAIPLTADYSLQSAQTQENKTYQSEKKRQERQHSDSSSKRSKRQRKHK